MCEISCRKKKGGVAQTRLPFAGSGRDYRTLTYSAFLFFSLVRLCAFFLLAVRWPLVSSVASILRLCTLEIVGFSIRE